MNNQPKARVGIVGLGRMGARLVQAAEQLGCDVVAALDSQEAPFAVTNNEKLAAVHRCDPAGFWQTPFDLLLVATTGPSHVPILQDAIAHGIKRAVVEKPMCVGVAEGERIRDAASEAGARIAVNHGRRYCPNFSRLVALDGSGEFGTLCGATVTLGAAGLGCMGVHYLDLFIRLFGGLPETIRAVGGAPTPNNPRGEQFDDPGAAVMLTWSGGRRAMFDISDDTGIPPIIDVRFTYGRVIIENEAAPWRYMHRKEEDRVLPLTRYGMPMIETPFPAFQPFGIIEMAEAAILDALGDGPVVSALDHGLDAIRVFAAIRHAMETDEIVRFPLPDSINKRMFAIP